MRRGRRPASGPSAEGTRGRILGAARAAFAERGFEGATVRDVAARAGVDPALVHHYFGTKQRLFVAAMQFPVDLGVFVPALVRGDPATVGERLVRAIVGLWDRPDVRQTLVGMVRSASTDPTAAAMTRSLLAEGPLLALATAIDLPDAPMRAALAGTQLIGLVMARYIVGVEPIASMSPERLAAVVGPTLTRYLAGDIGPDGEARPVPVG